LEVSCREEKRHVSEGFVCGRGREVVTWLLTERRQLTDGAMMGRFDSNERAIMRDVSVVFFVLGEKGKGELKCRVARIVTL